MVIVRPVHIESTPLPSVSLSPIEGRSVHVGGPEHGTPPGIFADPPITGHRHRVSETSGYRNARPTLERGIADTWQRLIALYTEGRSRWASPYPTVRNLVTAPEYCQSEPKYWAVCPVSYVTVNTNQSPDEGLYESKSIVNTEVLSAGRANTGSRSILTPPTSNG